MHTAGPSSRADLTRATGLNRSTVGALLAELSVRGLVVSSEPDASNRVGRPSAVISANDRVVALAVNPEIDAVTVGIVGLDGSVRRRVRHATDTVPSPEKAVDITATIIASLAGSLSGDVIVGIGVAVPGLVREADGVIRLAPHLGWADVPFAEPLAAATGLPVSAANDANLGANAERLFGAGRGCSDLVYLNGGASGIGAGVISGGRPLAGISGYAGELGHTLVNSAGRRCHCGATGCLETEVSQASLRDALGLERADPDELDAALQASDSANVHTELERQLAYIAVALRTATNTFNPQRIVLGGFLGSVFQAMPGRLEQLVAGQSLAASAEQLMISRADLGSNLLMIGAGELAFAPLLSDVSYGFHTIRMTTTSSRIDTMPEPIATIV